MTRSPSDDELEQQLNSNSNFNKSNESSNPSITFAHKISLSLKTPPYVKRDGKFYTVMTVKHAKKSRGGSSLNPSQNRFQKKPFNASFPGRDSQSNAQVRNHQSSKANGNQCLECGFQENVSSETSLSTSTNDQIKNHEHVSWYLGAFGTWWLVAQGWEIDSPSSPANETSTEPESSTANSSDPFSKNIHSLSLNPSGSIGKKSRKNWSRENLKDVQWKRELELKKKLNDYGVFELRVLKDEEDGNDLSGESEYAVEKKRARCRGKAFLILSRVGSRPDQL